VVAITTVDKDDKMVVIVGDTGCGISPEHFPFIFDKFYKGTPGRGGAEGDSGLGLYMVRSIMEGCGGSVEALSEFNAGTSIILTFCKDI
jgi:signal transduction histidine kinase